MLHFFFSILKFFLSIFRSKKSLICEISLLKKEFEILKRTIAGKRVVTNHFDRLFIIILNKAATVADIKRRKPDAVVVATGVTWPAPPIPGVTRKNVSSFMDVLTKIIDLSGKKVVVIGGAEIGTEVADFLAETGSMVTVIRRNPEIGAEMVKVFCC